MARIIAPSQDPQARNTIALSRNLLAKGYVILGVHPSTPTANCAPMVSAEMLRATVVMMTAKEAMKLYPPLRWMRSEEAEECEIGTGRALARARKTSRMKEEKEVREPQKPVERPM